MALDRNTQINFQGDPAKEKAFIESQDERTSEVARAAMPQLVVTDGAALEEAIRGADILDPTQPAGYEAADAPPGSEQGKNVNHAFDEDRAGLSDGYENKGEEGDGSAPLLSGYTDEDGTAHEATLNPDLAEQSNMVEVADPQGGDATKKGKK